ncbi:glycosyltransferase family 4 protein [Methylocystis parvus]|uniref:glycosyltransferase family 4 protein n=1 Tax=Methylocystis parvus TaxID=134 RepID=UPI003C707ACA
MASWLRSTSAGVSRAWRAWRGLEVAGHLDEVRHGAVRGWAWSPGRPDARLLVDVFVHGRFAGQCLANLPRPDLTKAGIGDGRHAFLLNLDPDLPALDDGAIRVFALGKRRYELNRTGRPVARQNSLDAHAYLRETFSSLLTTPMRSGEAPSRHASGSSAFDRLFGPSPAPSPPTILGRPLSAYLDYIRHRHGVASQFDTTVSEEDYAAYLKYYLKNYVSRRGRLRAPLPAGDIALMNEGPSADRPLAQSVAQKLLQRSAPPGASVFEKAFLWAAYESAAFGVEDCLTPEPQSHALLSCDDKIESFPLSRFMRRFLAGNPCLAGLDADKESDRKTAYLALLLFATANPHFLGYMPAFWIDRFLDGAASPFDEIARRVFGEIAYTRDDWRAAVDGQGYDLAAKRFRSFSAGGDRLLAPALILSDDRTVDVQLIGPFSRRLGISDSCRALAYALDKLDYSTRLCDFTLDHPNAVRAHDEARTAPPGRARVTLLHLNLEETPAAFAYLPDIFAGAHVVGMPYLETPKLGPSQLLGLSLADEIWAASKFVADAVGAPQKTQIVGTASRPVKAIGRVAARKLAYAGIAEPDDFIFLTACDALSGAYRKNPLGVIRAFLHAYPKDENVKLVIKAHSLDRVGEPNEKRIWDRVAALAAQCSRIVLLDRYVDEANHVALLEGADCLVSLHRAEGFGYHMLEAMTLGTPVIATAYSGNMEFCNEATAYLIPYTLTNIEHGHYHRASASQTWAEPDFAASVAAMRRVRDDDAARERIAHDARAYVEAHFSLDAFARRIDARLQQIIRAPNSSAYRRIERSCAQ